MNNRVLVVEDDPETAAFLTCGLEEAGFAVDWAQDGDDGVDRTLRGDYAIVILDRMLPGRDGLSVL